MVQHKSVAALIMLSAGVRHDAQECCSLGFVICRRQAWCTRVLQPWLCYLQASGMMHKSVAALTVLSAVVRHEAQECCSLDCVICRRQARCTGVLQPWLCYLQALKVQHKSVAALIVLSAGVRHDAQECCSLDFVICRRQAWYSSETNLDLVKVSLGVCPKINRGQYLSTYPSYLSLSLENNMALAETSSFYTTLRLLYAGWSSNAHQPNINGCRLPPL